MRLGRLKGTQERQRNAGTHHRGDFHTAGIVARQVFYPQQELEDDRHAFKNTDPIFLDTFQKRDRIDLIEDHQRVTALG